MWNKPDDRLAILRCTSKKYAEALVYNGSIKFNTPRSWVEEENKSGKGRGDRLEGAFASCSIFDLQSIFAHHQRYNDVAAQTIDSLTYFCRKRTMNLPCYCFYLLKHAAFDLPETEGWQKRSAVIPGAYFRDFANNLSPDEASRLAAEERPAFVVIYDMDRFIEMIRQKILSLGVKHEDFLYVMVDYQDKNTAFNWHVNSPFELKYKDIYFSDQSEGRIIINTDDRDVLEYLANNPIQIGSLNNIAALSDSYNYNGISIEAQMDIKLES